MKQVGSILQADVLRMLQLPITGGQSRGTLMQVGLYLRVSLLCMISKLLTYFLTLLTLWTENFEVGGGCQRPYNKRVIDVQPTVATCDCIPRYV